MNGKENNIESWNEYGTEYMNNAVCSFDFHYAMCLAGESTYQMLPDLRGLSVCDVGSGTGENAAYLASKADSVIGLEPVTTFVERARVTYGNIQNLVFLNTDFVSFSRSGKCQFDLITFIGSLDFIQLDKAFFALLNKITDKGSSVVISKFHPFWTTLFDHEKDPPKMTTSYFDTRIDVVRYGNLPFSRIHYSIERIIELFQTYGWQIDKIKEPRPVSKEKAAFYMGQCYEDEELMTRMRIIPMTLLIRFRRFS